MNYRAIWISDIHLGTKHCQVGKLLEFLRDNDCVHIYIVGDFIDGWQLRRKWYWADDYNLLIQKLLRKSRKKTRVTFITGNHDEFLEKFLGMSFGTVRLVERAVHTAADAVSRAHRLMGDEVFFLTGTDHQAVVSGRAVTGATTAEVLGNILHVDPPPVSSLISWAITLATAPVAVLTCSVGCAFAVEALPKAKNANEAVVISLLDVAFNRGEYRPGTMEGDLLIAHELAHTAALVAEGGDGDAPTLIDLA
jgi:hypothetical protein